MTETNRQRIRRRIQGQPPRPSRLLRRCETLAYALLVTFIALWVGAQAILSCGTVNA